MIGIIGFRYKSTGTNINLHITTVNQEPAHIRVTAPFVNLDKTYTVSNYTIVPLNGTLSQYENGTQFKGIEISSDVDISVTVTTSPHDLQEGFLALPVSAIGTRYVVASYYSSDYSEIVVTGVESDTDVSLKALTDNHKSTNISFRLQKFETYQYKSANDVSGSVVTSNKPVAVFSGSSGANIPVGIGDWQYLIEQMIPTKYWTTNFITPPIYPRRHYVLKFFSDQDSTEVHYYNSTNHFAVFMNKGSVAEFLFGTDPVVVLANKPISVIEYGHDGDNMIGDPFMTSVQGITQFQNSYKFVTEKYYYNSDIVNTIAITILKNSTDGLLLNGHSMSYWNAKNISVSPPLNEYITLFVNVSYNTYYKLHHTSGMEFGAVLYGGLHVNAGYGYPLQLTFNDKGNFKARINYLFCKLF
ncbi:uncharacterized protein LOC123562940 [Mercenaria mercenaria]|uniref:uncharacterized protein LOC123562940 n=1 Tax=Mercenaria mercenaria TaxID=6596 RepID=UPI00234F5E9E|nr:uncharacterized protein LOC123562940 [Mercenaria mercenaria]